jgi:hypothetical protein
MNETGYTLDVTWEQIDHIIVTELRNQMESLSLDLEKRTEGHGYPIFEHDVDKDVAMIRDRIRSFEQVLEFYGEKT